MNSTLTSLCVGHAELGDAGVELLCDALCRNAGVRVLDVEQRGLTARAGAALGRGASAAAPRLRAAPPPFTHGAVRGCLSGRVRVCACIVWVRSAGRPPCAR